jgi:hypothetical protein
VKKIITEIRPDPSKVLKYTLCFHPFAASGKKWDYDHHNDDDFPQKMGLSEYKKWD